MPRSQSEPTNHTSRTSDSPADLLEPAVPAPKVEWATPSEALRLVLYRPHLVRTVSVAIIVGTILFSINQLDVVMSGKATTSTWIKSVSTYLVPFCVANYGVLTATRRPRRT